MLSDWSRSERHSESGIAEEKGIRIQAGCKPRTPLDFREPQERFGPSAAFKPTRESSNGLGLSHKRALRALLLFRQRFKPAISGRNGLGPDRARDFEVKEAKMNCFNGACWGGMAQGAPGARGWYSIYGGGLLYPVGADGGTCSGPGGGGGGSVCSGSVAGNLPSPLNAFYSPSGTDMSMPTSCWPIE